MRIFILLFADRLPFYCLSTLVDTPLLALIFIWAYYFNLSTLVDTPLSDALYDKPLFLVLVHFSGHTFTSFDIYLSVLFQVVHFSGHPSFSCITWRNAGFNACPLWWTHLFQTRYMINRCFWYSSTLVDTALLSSILIWAYYFSLSTLVDTALLSSILIWVRHSNLSTLVDAPLSVT